MSFFVGLFAFLIFHPLLMAAEIKAVLLHPIFDQNYSCIEHWDGQLDEMGDALGADCTIQKFVEVKGLSWLRSYIGDGSINEDWYGWLKNVYSPTEGSVVKINENAVVNSPGVIGKGISSYIEIKRPDGIMVVVAHVDRIQVKVGEKLLAGQVIAKVGNNGQSRHPHIHIGAWKNKTPFQIRFNQKRITGR